MNASEPSAKRIAAKGNTSVMRHTFIAFSIAASLSVIGCTIPAAPAYPTQPGETNPGYAYCSLMAERAGHISTAESGAGWAILTSAVGGVAAGTLMTSANAASENPNVYVGVTGAALTAAGAILIPVAQAFFSRSDAAATLAKQGNEALTERSSDQNAYDRCVVAKGAWEESRSNSTKIATASLEKKNEVDKQTLDKLSRRVQDLEDGKSKPLNDVPNDTDTSTGNGTGTSGSGTGNPGGTSGGTSGTSSSSGIGNRSGGTGGGSGTGTGITGAPPRR